MSVPAHSTQFTYDEETKSEHLFATADHARFQAAGPVQKVLHDIDTGLPKQFPHQATQLARQVKATVTDYATLHNFPVVAVSVSHGLADIELGLLAASRDGQHNAVPIVTHTGQALVTVYGLNAFDEKAQLEHILKRLQFMKAVMVMLSTTDMIGTSQVLGNHLTQQSAALQQVQRLGKQINNLSRTIGESLQKKQPVPARTINKNLQNIIKQLARMHDPAQSQILPPQMKSLISVMIAQVKDLPRQLPILHKDKVIDLQKNPAAIAIGNHEARATSNVTNLRQPTTRLSVHGNKPQQQTPPTSNLTKKETVLSAKNKVVTKTAASPTIAKSAAAPEANGALKADKTNATAKFTPAAATDRIIPGKIDTHPGKTVAFATAAVAPAIKDDQPTKPTSITRPNIVRAAPTKSDAAPPSQDNTTGKADAAKKLNPAHNAKADGIILPAVDSHGHRAEQAASDISITKSDIAHPPARNEAAATIDLLVKSDEPNANNSSAVTIETGNKSAPVRTTRTEQITKIDTAEQPINTDAMAKAGLSVKGAVVPPSGQVDTPAAQTDITAKNRTEPPQPGKANSVAAVDTATHIAADPAQQEKAPRKEMVAPAPAKSEAVMPPEQPRQAPPETVKAPPSDKPAAIFKQESDLKQVNPLPAKIAAEAIETEKTNPRPFDRIAHDHGHPPGCACAVCARTSESRVEAAPVSAADKLARMKSMAHKPETTRTAPPTQEPATKPPETGARAQTRPFDRIAHDHGHPPGCACAVCARTSESRVEAAPVSAANKLARLTAAKRSSEAHPAPAG